MITLATKHYTRVEGALTEEDAVRVRRFAADKICLEVGANKGKETIAIAQVAKEVIVLVTEDNCEDVKENVKGFSNVSFQMGTDFEHVKNKYFDYIFVTKYMADGDRIRLREKLAENGVIEFGGL